MSTFSLTNEAFLINVTIEGQRCDPCHVYYCHVKPGALHVLHDAMKHMLICLNWKDKGNKSHKPIPLCGWDKLGNTFVDKYYLPETLLLAALDLLLRK